MVYTDIEVIDMKMYFKQRLFSWLDSYDIFDEAGNTLYTVKGEFGVGHRLRIYNAHKEPVGLVKQKIFTLLPAFEMYINEQYMGCIRREFALFRPQYTMDGVSWRVQGNLFEWDYTIFDTAGQQVATITKEFFNWTDTYMIDVRNPSDGLRVLMFVLAIDAEKCSRDN